MKYRGILSGTQVPNERTFLQTLFMENRTFITYDYLPKLCITNKTTHNFNLQTFQRKKSYYLLIPNHLEPTVYFIYNKYTIKYALPGRGGAVPVSSTGTVI